MFPISYVTEASLSKPMNYERTFEGELAVFNKLSTIVTAQFAANQTVKYAYRNLCDRGFRHFSYVERHWILLENEVMKLAEQVLGKRYEQVRFSKIDDENNLISVEWQGKHPEICKPEEVQERKNGKLFTYVATNQMAKAVKQLRKGADVNARGPFGRTPLYAVMKHPSQLDLLIARGAKVNVVDDFGMSPLDVATVFGEDSPFVRLLKAQGAQTGKAIAESLRERKPFRLRAEAPEFHPKGK